MDYLISFYIWSDIMALVLVCLSCLVHLNESRGRSWCERLGVSVVGGAALGCALEYAWVSMTAPPMFVMDWLLHQGMMIFGLSLVHQEARRLYWKCRWWVEDTWHNSKGRLPWF